MKLFILSSVTALAAGSVVRRQHVHNGGTGIPGISEGDLAALTNGGPALAELMGSPEATEKLSAFAQVLGAGPNSAGKMGHMMSEQMNGKYGKVPDPAGAAPRIVHLSPREKTPGSKSVKIRYGPYLVPNMGHKNRVEEEGMLSNFPDLDVTKPCSECTIIGMTTGLEYADGKNANIDSGMWLHHFVAFNEGPGRQDVTCAHRDISLPHISVGTTARNSERFWSAGNERTPLSFPQTGAQKAGYMVNKQDKFHLLMELMNANMEDAVLYFTITYDFVEGHPSGWDAIRPAWLDVANCGTSEVNAPSQTGSFTLNSTWTVNNLEGELINAAGHLHDGGQHTQTLIDGIPSCKSVATYGGDPAYIQKPSAGHSHGHGGVMKHISKMSICSGGSLNQRYIKPGQKWEIQAYYDYKKDAGMVHSDGKQDHVMGISIQYVRVKR